MLIRLKAKEVERMEAKLQGRRERPEKGLKRLGKPEISVAGQNDIIPNIQMDDCHIDIDPTPPNPAVPREQQSPAIIAEDGLSLAPREAARLCKEQVRVNDTLARHYNDFAVARSQTIALNPTSSSSASPSSTSSSLASSNRQS